jgi:hypothetical protein
VARYVRRCIEKSDSDNVSSGSSSSGSSGSGISGSSGSGSSGSGSGSSNNDSSRDVSAARTENDECTDVARTGTEDADLIELLARQDDPNQVQREVELLKDFEISESVQVRDRFKVKVRVIKTILTL